MSSFRPPQPLRRPLPPGGLEAVVAEGRRRRRRAAAGGGAGLVVVSIAVAATFGGSPLASLGVVEPAGPGEPTSSPHTPSPAASGTVDSPSPAADPGETPLPSPSASRSPGAVRSLLPVPTREPRPTGPPERPAGGWHEPMRARTEPVTGYCGGLRSRPGWCHATTTMTDAYGVSTLTWYACRSARGSSRATLRFPTEREADVTVSGPSGVLWTWSYDRSFDPDPHEVVVDPGFCRVWSTTWNSTDDAGEPLPVGTYRIDFEAVADGERLTHSIQHELT